jgi:hypothetical protein
MKTHDPVLALIAIAVLTIEAAVLLARAALVPVLALVLTVLAFSPPAAPEATTPPPAAPEPPLARPEPHPLALLADQLTQLPVTQLRQLAGTRSKRIRKAALIEQVLAMA